MPNDIRFCKNLKRLDLSFSKYLNLEKVFEQLQQMDRLEFLELVDCQLTNIPPSIGQFRQLKTLFLNRNGFKELPATMQYLRQLEALHLSSCNFIDADALFKGLSKCTKLRELDLSYCNLQMIPASIRQLSNLDFLDLMGNTMKALSCDMDHIRSLAVDYYLSSIPIPECLKPHLLTVWNRNRK